MGSRVLGVITNSVGGVIDFGAGIITGVRRSIFGEEAPRRVSEPLASDIDVTYLVYYRQGLIAVYPDHISAGTADFALDQLTNVASDDVSFIISEADSPILTLECSRPEQARDLCDLICVLKTQRWFTAASDSATQ